MALFQLSFRQTLIFLLSWIIVLLPGGAGADLPDLDQTVLNLQASYEKIEDLSARFSQTSIHKSSGVKEEGRGILMMKKPGRMRWEYQRPEARLIVSDGSTLYLYSPAEHQVIVQEAPQAFTSLAVNFLAGMGRLAEDFRIQWGRPEDKARKGNLLLELKPIQPQGQIRLILMEVHPETFLVERIVLKDVLANTTVLSFKKVKVNSALNDNLFKFVAPPGTEVIKGLPGTKRP
jgi:outer membrane lipoprotein carrier protein